MAKMGSRKHLKRYKAPKSWPIHPKEEKGLSTQVMF